MVMKIDTVSVLLTCRSLLLYTAIGTVILASTYMADARPPQYMKKRGWSDEFNGSYNDRHWVKSSQTFPKEKNGSGRGVNYYPWLVGFQQVGSRHCLKISSNTYGTVDKGGALDNTPGSGGHKLKYGWFEVASKVAWADPSVWCTWWTVTPSSSKLRDELDIMEYSWGNVGVKHWRWNFNKAQGDPERQVLISGRNWYRWRNNDEKAYIQSNVIDKFSLWSVMSTYPNGTRFYRDNGQIMSSNTRVIYPMFMRISSSPNRKRKETPKDAYLPNFYVDYVRVWTP